MEESSSSICAARDDGSGNTTHDNFSEDRLGHGEEHKEHNLISLGQQSRRHRLEAVAAPTSTTTLDTAATSVPGSANSRASTLGRRDIDNDETTCASPSTTMSATSSSDENAPAETAIARRPCAAGTIIDGLVFAHAKSKQQTKQESPCSLGGRGGGDGNGFNRGWQRTGAAAAAAAAGAAAAAAGAIASGNTGARRMNNGRSAAGVGVQGPTAAAIRGRTSGKERVRRVSQSRVSTKIEVTSIVRLLSNTVVVA